MQNATVHYIKKEGIELPSLYFSHERTCIKNQGIIISYSDYLSDELKSESFQAHVRFRTLGDITITGGDESEADNLEKIIQEVASTRVTERGNREDDKRSESAMEDRKKEGYF